jgi:aldose 1-epimerase
MEMDGLNNKEYSYIKEITIEEFDCIHLSAGGYEALIVPEVGANLVELKDINRNVSVLNSPNNLHGFERLRKFPLIFGVPVLFPPNRIEDGKFKVEDKVYEFKINEKSRNNYMHGFISKEKWIITKKEVISESEVQIEAVFNFTKEHNFYTYFPHESEYKLVYNLSNRGLKQTMTITNFGNEKMPIGVGYHTAFRVPFCENGYIKDYRVLASIDKRWEQNERLLPTSKLLELTEEEQKYHNKGIRPNKYELEAHYKLKSMDLKGKKINGAIIQDERNGIRVVYDMGESYKHFVIWNGLIDNNVLCIEPQSCIINAPNVDLDNSITGFKTLNPKEEWTGTTNIYVEEIE